MNMIFMCKLMPYIMWFIAERGEAMNASTDNSPKIEILPSSDFSELTMCLAVTRLKKIVVFVTW